MTTKEKFKDILDLVLAWIGGIIILGGIVASGCIAAYYISGWLGAAIGLLWIFGWMFAFTDDYTII